MTKSSALVKSGLLASAIVLFSGESVKACPQSSYFSSLAAPYTYDTVRDNSISAIGNLDASAVQLPWACPYGSFFSPTAQYLQCVNEFGAAYTKSFVVKQAHRPKGESIWWVNHPDWDNGWYAPMRAWEDAGVSNSIQKKLTFTILNKPSKQNVKHIAFFVNGQEVCAGYPQTTTGTNEGWRARITQQHGNDNWTSGPITYDKRSAAQIFVDGLNKPHSYGQDLRALDLTNTLVLSLADASFAYPGFWTNGVYNAIGWMLGNCNTGNSLDNNNEVLEGWKNWLSHNVNWNSIESFYGYGMSRGGCFVTRFAHKLTSESVLNSTAKVILMTNDPVCNMSEMPDESKTGHYQTSAFNFALVSPFAFQWSDTTGDPDYSATRHRAIGIQVNNLFGSHPKSNIRWLNYVGGADVLETTDHAMNKIYAFVDINSIDGEVDNPAGPGKRKGSFYQNLQLTESGNVIKSGFVPADHRDGTTQLSAAQMLSSQTPAGNPLPECCDCWYNQVWVPFSHMAMGASYQPLQTIMPPGTPFPLNNLPAPCGGMSGCGFGLDPSKLPANTLVNASAAKHLNFCAVNPRPEFDWVYKLQSFGTKWGKHWFAIATPQQQVQLLDCATVGAQPCVNKGQVFQGWQYGTGAPVYGEECPTTWTDTTGHYGAPGTTYTISAEFIDLGPSLDIQGQNDWTEFCWITVANPNYRPKSVCRPPKPSITEYLGDKDSLNTGYGVDGEEPKPVPIMPITAVDTTLELGKFSGETDSIIDHESTQDEAKGDIAEDIILTNKANMHSDSAYTIEEQAAAEVVAAIKKAAESDK